MRRSQSFLVAGFAILAALVVGLGVWLFRAPPVVPEVVVPPPPAPASGTGEEAPSKELLPLAPIADESHQEVGDPTQSTVAWPIRLRLDLIEAAAQPRAAGMVPLGASATARLSGSLTGGLGEALEGTVKFIAGPNEGRELRTNSQGKFGASDLYPGLAVVDVDGPGGLDARRPVRLRAGAESLLHIGFGLPGAASGKVLDREGKPIVGATVELD
ncbi:MAG TPA: hypothetical protein VM509_08920, partial [Planctomycetota bacterium]|nr:hypothetical protein [Planctomycetota bacterium]